MQKIELYLLLIILIFSTLTIIAVFVSILIDVINQFKFKLIQKKMWKNNKKFNAKD